MSYVGKWQFHSIGTVDDETCERVWLNAEEYIKAPMPYVDETDEEAVADEMKERQKTVGTILEVCEDGKLYALMPLPEGVSKEEVEQAVREAEQYAEEDKKRKEEVETTNRADSLIYELEKQLREEGREG